MSVELTDSTDPGFAGVVDAFAVAAEQLRVIEGEPIPLCIAPYGYATPHSFPLDQILRFECSAPLQVWANQSDRDRLKSVLDVLQTLGEAIARADENTKAAVFPGWCPHYLAGAMSIPQPEWSTRWATGIALDALIHDQRFDTANPHVSYWPDGRTKVVQDLVAALIAACLWQAERLAKSREPLSPVEAPECCPDGREAERKRPKTPAEILAIVRRLRTSATDPESVLCEFGQVDLDRLWDDLGRSKIAALQCPTITKLESGDRFKRGPKYFQAWREYMGALTVVEQLLQAVDRTQSPLISYSCKWGQAHKMFDQEGEPNTPGEKSAFVARFNQAWANKPNPDHAKKEHSPLMDLKNLEQRLKDRQSARRKQSRVDGSK